jgi:folate-binding protein YgfZ
MPIALLPERGVVELAGEDAQGFLQGLVSNDVTEAAPGHAVWAALLTPQGKWQADFFVFAEPDRLLLDCEAAQASELVRRLARFRLRAKVTLRDASHDFAVLAGWGTAPAPPGASPDPRLAAAGWRWLAPPGTPGDATADDYDLHRLGLGLPDGSRDLEAEQSILLEAGFDELHGVSWTKGCYMGQELTARTRYRGLVKRRLVPVAVVGPLPPRGTPVLLNGTEVGDMRSGRGALGMALLRLPALQAPALACGAAVLEPRPTSWMALPGED